MPISRQAIRISKKPDIIFSIDALGVRLCSHFARAAASNTQEIQKNNLRSFPALPAPDTSLKKSRFNYIFIVNYSY